MNRGSNGCCTPCPRRPTCFNEAPIHESGKSRSCKRPLTGDWRFNEAPIHESGKYPQGGGYSRSNPRFNEAPIHESGKSGSCQPRPCQRLCFNEAPIHESGKYREATGESGKASGASMRPRFMNRGSPETMPR